MKHKYFKNLKLFFLLFSICYLFSTKAYSQCAGTENIVIICDKELDTTLQDFNLFDQLLGAPELGGTWTSNDRLNQNALDAVNGTVNLWTINRAGDHIFTYTNENCNESATVTITLGGYPGEDNILGGANACSDDTSVNLFTFLDNEQLDLNTDINGTWTGIGDAAINLSENSFNAKIAGPGTYSFTYTVEDTTSCPEKTASVVLEVHRAPDSGIGENITICDSEDLSVYANFNLFDLLNGEDTNGVWTETNGTSQISDSNDSIVNIEELYNNNGNGEYTFSYTVFPTHGVCDSKTTTVTIFIPRLFGAFSVDDLCGGNLSQISILYDNPSKIYFEHDLTYEIRNSVTNELVFSTTETNLAPNPNLIDIITRITITPNITILTPGTYNIIATSINNVEGLLCESLTITNGTFTIYNPEASNTQTCFNKDDNTTVTINNYTTANGNLVNDTETVSYTISHNSESVTVDAYEITFIDGAGTVPVDLSLFSDVVESDVNLVFNNATNNGLSCINYSFPIQLFPSNILLNLNIDNECNASNMEVLVDAPTLSNGSYKITYEVTEISNTELLINNEINIVGGQANYQVDISNLNEGDYQVTLKSVQNDTHPCRTEFEFELTETFSVGGIPDAPVLDAAQTFCFSDFTPNGPTIADILLTSGENLVWYEDATFTTTVNDTTLLVDGEDYYVSASSASGCESSEKSIVVVTINVASTVTSNDVNPVFCGSQNATLADLDVTNLNNGEIVWYDTENNVLETNTTLLNETSYFAVENVNGCESVLALQFNPIIVSPTTPQYTGETALCALDELTLLDLEANITTEDNTVLIWYNENGTELSSADLIEENINYYVVRRETTYGCESDSILITVSLSNCDPEQYEFFVPDGFSPNGDGINDLFYIPNIAFFYPNYDYEIYNRYGQSLFKGNVNNPTWDGSSNSSQTETTSGVYFYILNYNDNDLKPVQGRIYLSK